MHLETVFIEHEADYAMRRNVTVAELVRDELACSGFWNEIELHEVIYKYNEILFKGYRDLDREKRVQQLIKGEEEIVDSEHRRNVIERFRNQLIVNTWIVENVRRCQLWLMEKESEGHTIPFCPTDKIYKDFPSLHRQQTEDYQPLTVLCQVIRDYYNLNLDSQYRTTHFGLFLHEKALASKSTIREVKAAPIDYNLYNNSQYDPQPFLKRIAPCEPVDYTKFKKKQKSQPPVEEVQKDVTDVPVVAESPENKPDSIDALSKDAKATEAGKTSPCANTEPSPRVAAPVSVDDDKEMKPAEEIADEEESVPIFDINELFPSSSWYDLPEPTMSKSDLCITPQPKSSVEPAPTTSVSVEKSSVENTPEAASSTTAVEMTPASQDSSRRPTIEPATVTTTQEKPTVDKNPVVSTRCPTSTMKNLAVETTPACLKKPTTVEPLAPVKQAITAAPSMSKRPVEVFEPASACPAPKTSSVRTNLMMKPQAPVRKTCAKKNPEQKYQYEAFEDTLFREPIKIERPAENKKRRLEHQGLRGVNQSDRKDVANTWQKAMTDMEKKRARIAALLKAQHKKEQEKSLTIFEKAQKRKNEDVDQGSNSVSKRPKFESSLAARSQSEAAQKAVPPSTPKMVGNTTVMSLSKCRDYPKRNTGPGRIVMKIFKDESGDLMTSLVIDDDHNRRWRWN